MKHQLTIIFLTSISLLFFEQAFAQHELSAPKNGAVYVIAHRGAHGGNIPENSLPAYQRAIDLGCDFVEIDLRTTKDGAIVSIHNQTIDAYVIGTTGQVSEMTLAELRSLDIGEKVGYQQKNVRVPTFEEILELCKDKVGIYLDLKAADPKILIAIIKKYKMEHDIVWYVPASRQKTLLEIKHNCSRCLIMPDPGAEQNIDKVIDAYQPKLLATDMDHLSRSFIEKAHAKNIMIFTDDDEDDLDKWESEWGKIISWGTNGIQTDQPSALIKYLNRK